MLDYRLYLIGPTGHVMHAIEMDCADDDAAIARCADHDKGQPMELWRREHFVKGFHIAPPRGLAKDAKTAPRPAGALRP